ncbi:MAG: YcgL domain-containing protein [Gammaproteobacteria bacterium]|nr:MAG: YcgL domain-containing protein [Gammaproteobacteria bacterium]
MYLYVPRGADLEELPDGLLRFLGHLEAVMELPLGPERKLARADVCEVMEKLRGQGYFVQMPPRPFRPRLRQGE